MQDDGNKKIGDEEDLYGGTSQPIILEKRVTLTLEFRMAFHEITPETAVEKRPARSREEVLGDEWMMGWVGRQAKILHALLADEEALRQFIACGVIDLIVAGDGRLLRKGLKVETEEEALRPLIEGLGGEVAESYSEVWGEDIFGENIELLLASTPIRLEKVSGRGLPVEGEKEVGGRESDKYLM